MKPIMSFWSKPFLNNKHNEWINKESFRLAWEISVNSITKSMGKPTLYTDSEGKRILVDEFGLDFEEVVECMDALDNFDPRFSALSRYQSILHQEEPFVHMDYDFFLWESLPEDLESEEIIFQSKSTFDNKRDDRFNVFQSPIHRPELFPEQIDNLPEWWADNINESEFSTYNCSIIGGNNLSLLKEIAHSVIEFAGKETNDSWDNFENAIRDKYPDNALLKEYGSIASYTISEFIPNAICSKNNVEPALVTNECNMHSVQFTHISFAKSRNEEIHGLLMKRMIADSSDGQSSVPTVSIVIIPNDNESLQNCVLRSIVPRKMSPDEVIVVDNGIKSSERDFINNLPNVKVLEQSPAFTRMEIMKAAAEEATCDIVIYIDSYIKVPRQYIEKSIASVLQYPNAAFCAAANEFQDYDKETGYAYGATFDGLSPSKPMMSEYPAERKGIDEVDCLYGGMYIFPRAVLEKAFEIPHTAIEYMSSYIVENDMEIRCIKNLIVSQDFKRVSSK